MRKLLIAAAALILVIMGAALFLGMQVQSSFQPAPGQVSASPGDNDTEELNSADYRKKR